MGIPKKSSTMPKFKPFNSTRIKTENIPKSSIKNYLIIFLTFLKAVLKGLHQKV